MVSIEKIKELRETTGVSLGKCREALEKAGGDIKEAQKILRKVGQGLAEKRSKKEVKKGIIDSYIHGDGKIGVIIKLQCESDFVARSDDFKKLSHEICLQIAAMDPEETPLLEQLWIKDQDKTIKELVQEYIAKLGENIVIKKFTRYEL